MVVVHSESGNELLDPDVGAQLDTRFFQLAHDILCVVDVDGRYLRVNPACKRVLGWAPELLTTRGFRDYLHPDDSAAADRYFDAILAAQGGDAGSLLVRMRTADGDWRWIDWVGTFDPEASILFAAGRDVHAEVSMRARLQEREALLTRLVDVEMRSRDEEQVRIAAELHDSVVQHCVAALMYLDMLGDAATEPWPHLATAREQVQEALRAIRRIMSGLDAIEQTPGGLAAALEKIGTDIARQFNLEIDVSARLPDVIEPPLAAVACRIAREGLVNAGKHSGCQSVRLTADASDGELLVIEVHDDGCGRSTSPPSGRGLGLGLAMLRERVRSVGGDIGLTHGDDGTTLVASIPLATGATTGEE